jgi:putative FmdB family regulatory protein
MPIYEYTCAACGHDFELLVRHDTEPACPECASGEIERRLSLPTVKSSGTHDLAMRAARKRDKKQGFEQMMAQREYEASHDD